MIYTTQKNERLSKTNATKNWDELGCSEGQTVPTPKVTLVMLLLLQIMNEERQRLITINLVYLSWWQLQDFRRESGMAGSGV